MRIKFHRVERKEIPVFRANQHIRVPEVFLIDENNAPIGKITTLQALALAQEADLDLVEVNPKANPPVVKIVNLGQLKYEREKQAHKQKILRGRERQHLQKAREIIAGFVTKLMARPDLKVEAEQPLTNQGGRFTIILINKK